MNKKSSMIRGVATLEGENFVLFNYLSESEIWPDKRVAFLVGNNLIVFNYQWIWNLAR